MMGYKKMIASVLACLLFSVVLAAPLYQACEEQEEENDEVKDDYSEDESGSCDPSEPVSILDVLLERYPLLDQIIEMILDLFYRWLSNYYSG
jgi:hypothetical protein